MNDGVAAIQGISNERWMVSIGHIVLKIFNIYLRMVLSRYLSAIRLLTEQLKIAQ